MAPTSTTAARSRRSIDDRALVDALHARKEACPGPAGRHERVGLAAEMLGVARRTLGGGAELVRDPRQRLDILGLLGGAGLGVAALEELRELAADRLPAARRAEDGDALDVLGHREAVVAA